MPPQLLKNILGHIDTLQGLTVEDLSICTLLPPYALDVGYGD